MLTCPQAGPEDRVLVSDAITRLERPLRVVRDHLATNGGHLVGGRFTVADLNAAEIIRYAWTDPGMARKWPGIAAWLAGCQNRPAFQRMWQARLAEPA